MLHFVFSALIVFLATGFALADTLNVTVHNIVTSGVLYMAVYDNAPAFEGRRKKGERRGPTKDAFFDMSEAVESGSVGYEITLPAGIYAISAFVDKNQNGKMDTRSFIPIPTEQFGFSKNAMGRFGPPSFKAASFRVNGLSHQAIKLRGR